MMKQYYQENKERFINELFSLLRIPSVSSDPEHKEDMHRCAGRLVELLLEAGADKAQVMPTTGHPVVYGERIQDQNLPTILIYGHYDVQPEGDVKLWNTDPYEPVIKDGAIWGRGANDDKGQTFMHIKAFEYLVRTGKIRHNIKFLFEGEEEIGSPSLTEWVRSHTELLSCDLMLVSDTTMISEKVPSINCGMRGLTYMMVDIKGPSKDVHSGHFGGAIVNPINALCSMISSLIDKDGHITIDGFYDDVVELSASDRALLSKAPFNQQEFNDSLGIKDVAGEKGYTTLERSSIRPCLDVNGIWGGFTGDGSMTIIASEAHAKISMRLVPNQDSAKIAELFTRHIRKIAPKGVEVTVKPSHGGNGFLIPISSPAYQAASKAIAEVYGIEPVPSRGGGSIAILADMQKLLGADPLLMGFGLERDCIHSPNESYLLSQWEKGMESIALFYEYFKG